jgi:hypothetical protein
LKHFAIAYICVYADCTLRIGQAVYAAFQSSFFRATAAAEIRRMEIAPTGKGEPAETDTAVIESRTSMTVFLGWVSGDL